MFSKKSSFASHYKTYNPDCNIPIPVTLSPINVARNDRAHLFFVAENYCAFDVLSEQVLFFTLVFFFCLFTNNPEISWSSYWTYDVDQCGSMWINLYQLGTNQASSSSASFDELIPNLPPVPVYLKFRSSFLFPFFFNSYFLAVTCVAFCPPSFQVSHSSSSTSNSEMSAILQSKSVSCFFLIS